MTIENISASADSLAKTIRDYLMTSYDQDLTILRCAKSGRITYRISDEELTTMFSLANNDLAKLAERIELLISQSHTAPSWLFEDDQSLDRLRISEPVEFFNFAIKSLVSLSSYYLQFRRPRDNSLTTDGKFQLNSEFYRFAEQSFSYWEQQGTDSLAQLNDLNDKLILMLCIGATSQVEKILDSELSFHWVSEQLLSGQLFEKLSKLLNNIINRYRIAHGLALQDKLTISDIERISSEARNAYQLANERARQQRAKLAASSSSYFKKLKQRKAPDYYLENLIGELMIANRDKTDYFNQLTKRKAELLWANKPLAKLDKIAKLTMRNTATPAIKTVTVKIRVANPNPTDQQVREEVNTNANYCANPINPTDSISSADNTAAANSNANLDNF